VQHTAMREKGCEPVSSDAPFRIDEAQSSSLPRGFLLGSFGRSDKPTEVVVVNLDYTRPAKATVTGPGKMEIFDPATGQWTPTDKAEAQLNLPPGGGRLVRVAGR